MTDTLRKDEDCIKRNTARRVRECKARRAERIARRRFLKNRIPHLPVRLQVKLIVIELLRWSRQDGSIARSRCRPSKAPSNRWTRFDG